MDERVEVGIRERLERSQRRQRRVVTLAVLTLAGVALTGQAGMTIPTIPNTKILEAERVVLKDPKGDRRALLSGADDGAARLALLNEDSKAGVLLATVPSAGGRLGLAVAQALIPAEQGPDASAR